MRKLKNQQKGWGEVYALLLYVLSVWNSDLDVDIPSSSKPEVRRWKRQ